MLTLSTFRRESFLRRFFQILLALEFLFLCYVNLCLTSHILDGDGADLYGHIIEMAEQGTLFLPEWKYTTTMELDCVTIFALPLYLLTRRIFGSVGIANILLILLLAAVILRVVKNLGGTSLQGYFSLLLVLLPYDVGMLDYMDMLLFGGSQYLVKVLVPLLLVILLTEKTRTPSRILFAVLYSFLLFVTSLSSGLYVLLLGLFPLFLYRAFLWCQAGTPAGRDKTRHFVFLFLLTLAASLEGFFCRRPLASQPERASCISSGLRIWQQPFLPYSQGFSMSSASIQPPLSLPSPLQGSSPSSRESSPSSFLVLALSSSAAP